MAMSDVMGATPVYNVGEGSGEFGGGFMWVFFLFFLLAWGGNGGMFGGGNNVAGAEACLSQQGVLRDIYGGFAQLAQQSSNQTATLQQSIASCCCNTQREIDNVRYDLTVQGTANTQAILDRMCQSEITALRDKAAAYELQLSNQAQSANIIAALRPTPIPAYITCSPYTSATTGCF